MITFRFEFEPRDLWIGVHWKYRSLAYDQDGIRFSATDRATYDQAAAGLGVASHPPRPRFDLWLCLLPCLPLHVVWWGKEAAKRPEPLLGLHEPSAGYSNMLSPDAQNPLDDPEQLHKAEDDLVSQVLGCRPINFGKKPQDYV